MKLKSLCEITNGSILSRFQKIDAKKEWLPVLSVKAALGDRDEKNMTELEVNHPQLVRAQIGDVIMSMTQPNVFVIDEPLSGWVVPSTFAYFHIKDIEQLNPYYLKWFFEYSEEYKRQLHLIQNSGNMVQFLKIGELKEVEITLPSIDKQEKVANMMQLIEQEQKLYQQKIEKQKKMMNYVGNHWIKENNNGN